MCTPFPAQHSVRTSVSRLPLKISLVALAGVIVLATDVYAIKAHLTMVEAARRTTKHLHQFYAETFAVAIYHNMAVAAGQLRPPKLKGRINKLQVSGRDRFNLGNVFITMRRVGVMQVITCSNKRRLRSDRFELDSQKTVTKKTTTAVAIERDTAHPMAMTDYQSCASCYSGTPFFMHKKDRGYHPDLGAASLTMCFISQTDNADFVSDISEPPVVTIRLLYCRWLN